MANSTADYYCFYKRQSGQQPLRPQFRHRIRSTPFSPVTAHDYPLDEEDQWRKLDRAARTYRDLAWAAVGLLSTPPAERPEDADQELAAFIRQRIRETEAGL